MPHGEFSPSPPTTSWSVGERPDRRMILKADFWYRDPKDVTWDAPANWSIDGASIPRALWTLVGSPYTGNYRLASIVHDVACDRAGDDKVARRAADRMYFHACRAGGCSWWEATIQYLGVRVGAMWPHTKTWYVDELVLSQSSRLFRQAGELQMEADFQRVAELVLQEGETEDSDVLEVRADRAFARVLRATD